MSKGKSQLKNVLTFGCYKLYNPRRCYCFEIERNEKRNHKQKKMYEERVVILKKMR